MNREKYLASILGVISLLMITSGVTLAVFNYFKEGQTENSITTDGITFIYNEESKIGRGILIEDASPMTDTQGKTQTNQKFDFRVVSRPGNTKIKYTVTARKISNGDTLDSLIDLYLTDQAPSNEEVFLDKTVFGSLSPYKESTVEKILYEKVIDKNDTVNGEYNQAFRLRMWLDSSADFSDSTLNNKEFKIIVNVNAVNYTEPSGNTPSTLATSISSLASTDTTNLAADDPDGNVRYIGANPTNYIEYNNDLWRIVGVFDGRVKIVKYKSLGEYSWDTSETSVNDGYGVNEWSQADLMTELNTDYLNPSLEEDPYWYTGVNNEKENLFDRTKALSLESQNLIDNGTFYLGVYNDPVTQWNMLQITSNGETPIPTFVYTQERMNKQVPICRNQTPVNSRCTDSVERTLSWTGKVGLLSLSDYYFSLKNNETKSWINYLPNHNFNGTENTFNVYSKWLLAPMDFQDYGNFVITLDGAGKIGRDTVNGKWAVHPVVFLKSNVLLKSGTGTYEDPYKIGLE